MSFWSKKGNGDNGNNGTSPKKAGQILQRYEGANPNEALTIYRSLCVQHGEGHVHWVNREGGADFYYQ